MDKKDFDQLRSELVEISTQMAAATKREHSNLISSFNNKVDTIKESQIRQEEHTKAVDKHLKQLNSKVATNIRNIESNRLLITTENELKKDAFNNALKEAVEPLAEKVNNNYIEIFSGKRILYIGMALSALFGVILYGYFQYTIKVEIDSQFEKLEAKIL